MRLASIPGTVPPPGSWPTGCRFAGRCQFAQEKCTVPFPALPAHGDGSVLLHPGRRAARADVTWGAEEVGAEIAPGAGAAEPVADEPRRRARPDRWSDLDDRPRRPRRRRARPVVTPALEIRDLVVRYGSGRKARQAPPAIDGVSFDIAPGETVGLVGESGSGQVDDRQGRARPAAADRRHGPAARPGHHRPCRSRSGSRVGGRPAGRLPGPVLVAQPGAHHRPDPGRAAAADGHRRRPRRCRRRGRAWSRSACPATPSTATRRSSPAASGSASPSPGRWSATRRSSSSTSRCRALDLSTQAQVLNLLADLRDQHGLAFLFIAHDLGVVRFLAQRIVVLYRGQIMESGPVESVTQQPAAPVHGRADRRRAGAAAGRAGRPPCGPRGARRRHRRRRRSRRRPAARSCPRCPLATDICVAERPPLRLVDGNLTACHHAEQVPAL